MQYMTRIVENTGEEIVVSYAKKKLKWGVDKGKYPNRTDFRVIPSRVPRSWPSAKPHHTGEQ